MNPTEFAWWLRKTNARPPIYPENLDAVKPTCKNRNVTADVDRVVALDDERKRMRHEYAENRRKMRI